MKHDIPFGLFFICIVTLLTLAAAPLFASDRSRYMGPPGMDGQNGSDGKDGSGAAAGIAAGMIPFDFDTNDWQGGAGAAIFDSEDAYAVGIAKRVCVSSCGNKMLLNGKLVEEDGETGGGVGATFRW